MSEIGREIIVLRAQKGWTQQKLAESLKISQRTVASWESGNSVPRKAMTVRIAHLFDLPNDHFFGYLDKEMNSASGGEYDEIEDLLAETTAGMSEKKKAQVMERFQNIINGK